MTFNGDRATARAYVVASHTFEKAVLDDSARAGGWYDATLARTEVGWRFKTIALTIVSNTGKMIRGGPPDGGMPPAKGGPA